LIVALKIDPQVLVELRPIITATADLDTPPVGDVATRRHNTRSMSEQVFASRASVPGIDVQEYSITTADGATLYLLDVQACHVAWVIASALARGIVEVEASASAEAAWVDNVMQRSALVAERRKACTPGYYNREGRVDDRTQQGSFFIGGPTEYADILKAWRVEGTLSGLDLRIGEIAR
jgi:hypothetical protein